MEIGHGPGDVLHPYLPDLKYKSWSTLLFWFSVGLIVMSQTVVVGDTVEKLHGRYCYQFKTPPDTACISLYLYLCLTMTGNISNSKLSLILLVIVYYHWYYLW